MVTVKPLFGPNLDSTRWVGWFIACVLFHELSHLLGRELDAGAPKNARELRRIDESRPVHVDLEEGLGDGRPVVQRAGLR